MGSAIPSSNEHADSNLNDTATSTINVDPSEVEKFNKLASEWWSNTGAFATLHEINPLRLNWIEENVKRGYQSKDLAKSNEAPHALNKTAETGLSGKKCWMSVVAVVYCQNRWHVAVLMSQELIWVPKI